MAKVGMEFPAEHASILSVFGPSFFYCGRGEKTRWSCVEVRAFCYEDCYARVAGFYGPVAEDVVKELLSRVEEIVRLRNEWHAKAEEFENGKATLRDVIGAMKAYKRALERLGEDVRSDTKTVVEALNKSPLDYDVIKEEPGECEELVRAINKIVEHPESGEW